jgi:ribosomal RNA-processing protein 36
MGKSERPQELSSKRPQVRAVPVISAKPKFRDPRFDPLVSAAVNRRALEKDFAFIHDYKQDELKELEKAIANERNPDKIKEYNDMVSVYVGWTSLAFLTRLQKQEIRNHERNVRVNQKLEEMKKEEYSKVEKGKMPFFLKKSKVKELYVQDKFEELKKEGRLQSYLAKKRKANSAKDKRWLPYPKKN